MLKLPIIETSKLEIEVPYEGVTFTLTRLSYHLEDRSVIAEGISRRSSKDAPNPILGKEISFGRAMKALKKKLLHEHIRHNLMG